MAPGMGGPAARRARPDPDQQAFALLAQVGKRRPVDPLGAEYVDVILLNELVGHERLGGAENHVSRIMDDDIESSTVRDDLRDTGFGRRIGLNVQFDRTQIGPNLGGPRRSGCHLRRIAPYGLPHGGVYDVTSLGQCLCGHETEARGGAGD
ncbi:MAG: hypothetical protein JWQ24_4644 [Tardiphaga sp.]|nr:hypothetical protein [Tardiphaga sp.]